MNRDYEQLLDESIQLELNVGQLYLLFHQLFPEDAEFWWALSIEEENHAALLRTVQEMENLNVAMPPDLFPEGLHDLKESNKLINQARIDFKDQPDRIKAFQFAYLIENSAGEYHYDAFMQNAPESRITDIFKLLNGDDVDHANRIRQYMEQHRIPLQGS
jgi:hypothetical protein